MELYGQTISKVKHIKDGEGQNKKGEHWTWKMWSFSLENNNQWFTYFTSGKKPEPFEGMKIGYLKYTEKQEGEYLNRTVDEIKVAEDSPQAPVATKQAFTQKKDTDWDAIARGKCKFGFLQQAFVPYLKGELFKVEDEDSLHLLEQNAELFADMCMRTLSDSTTAPQTAKEEKDIGESTPDVPYADSPPLTDADTPF